MSRGDARRLGAALGVASAPAAAFGAWWGGIGESHPLIVAGVAVCAGGILGALCWLVFHDDEVVATHPGPGFSALFAGCVGLIAGTFAGFPMGGIFGAVGGAGGGLATALAWRRGAGLGGSARATVAALVGGSLGLGVAVALGWPP